MIKSTVLTEEQKKKLLEMAKFFYPEYEKVRTKHRGKGHNETGHIGINSSNFLEFPKVEWGNVVDHLTYEKIYWLEFVVFDLYQKVRYYTYRDTMTINDVIYSNHPIDFLYEKFKQFKP